MPKFQRATVESIAEGEKTLTFEFTVPEKAKRNRKDPSDARWTANVSVIEAVAEETTSRKGDDHLLCIVTTVITDGADDAGANLDRQVQYRGRLNYEAFNKGDKKNKQYKMHMMTLGSLSQLFRAAGLYDGGDIEEETFAAAFPEEGASQLVGQGLTAEIHQSRNEETGKVYPEIDAWLVPDGGKTGTMSTGTGSNISAAVTL